MRAVLTENLPQQRGPRRAAARLGPILGAGHLRTGGFLTWIVGAVLHVLAPPQLQNRFSVQTQWLCSYLTGQHSSRLIAQTPGPLDIAKRKPAT